MHLPQVNVLDIQAFKAALECIKEMATAGIESALCIR
jgi:hypothetical protein